MMNIAQNIRSPAEVAFPVMESLIKQCLVVEIGERVESVTSLMNQPVLWSLVEQLKHRIKPENLVFGLNRLETKDVINDHLIAELQKKLEETQKKMMDLW
ncbi:Oidioi.mRNA.OKI2018_I69.chr2.g8397.t1.cds [Oikopleura dioica]|uniref:Oidioi.mRNA.OKI2018_I69.chr2.g8397.t1.cds n=1 Tax=Oikopleura dioica TaxID=34765 RepID=A0ABN7T937_OIKDI|nr:Oidioi.mRNA.OKI2018_I69.chr2.g8397.t1.cds [Oikopleura dioica]